MDTGKCLQSVVVESTKELPQGELTVDFESTASALTEDTESKPPISPKNESEVHCDEVNIVLQELIDKVVTDMTVDVHSDKIECGTFKYINEFSTLCEIVPILNEIITSVVQQEEGFSSKIVNDVIPGAEDSQFAGTNSERTSVGEVATNASVEEVSLKSSNHVIRRTGYQHITSGNNCPVEDYASHIFNSSDMFPSHEKVKFRRNLHRGEFCRSISVDPPLRYGGSDDSVKVTDPCDDSVDATDSSGEDSELLLETTTESTNESSAIVKTFATVDEKLSFSSVFENTSLLIPLSSPTIDVQTVKAVISRLKKSRVNVRDDAAAYLARDVTYKIKVILQEATKFLEMGKRKRMSSTDIDHALQLVKVETLFGIGLPSSLSKMGKSCIIGEESGATVDKRRVINFDQAAAEMEAAAVPRETVIHKQWLHLTEEEDILHFPWFSQHPSCAETAGSIAKANVEEKVDTKVEPTESDISFETLSSSAMRRRLKKPVTFVYSELIHLRGQSYGLLTKELEIYFREIKSSCFGNCDDKRLLALQSLQHDPNISKMVTHFSSLISHRTAKYVVNPNLTKLTIVMRMLHHIILNPHVLNIKLFLHEMLPSVITCIVCSTVSSSPEYDNDWKLRDYATVVLKLICDKYSSSVNKIQERAVAVFQKALQSPELDLSSVYGSLHALKALGASTTGGDVIHAETKLKLRVDDCLSRSGSLDKNKRIALRIRDHLNSLSLARIREVIDQSNSRIKSSTTSKDKKSKEKKDLSKPKEESKKPQPSPWPTAAPKKSLNQLGMPKRPVLNAAADGVPLNQYKPMPIPRFPMPLAANNSTPVTSVQNQAVGLASHQSHPVQTAVEQTKASCGNCSGGSLTKPQNTSNTISAVSALNCHDYSLNPYAAMKQRPTGINRTPNRTLQIRNPGLVNKPLETGDARNEALAMNYRRSHGGPHFTNLVAGPRLLPPRRGPVPLSGAASTVASGIHSLTGQSLDSLTTEQALATSADGRYTLKQVSVYGVNEFYLQPVYFSGAMRPRLLASPRGSSNARQIPRAPIPVTTASSMNGSNNAQSRHPEAFKGASTEHSLFATAAQSVEDVTARCGSEDALLDKDQIIHPKNPEGH